MNARLALSMLRRLLLCYAVSLLPNRGLAQESSARLVSLSGTVWDEKGLALGEAEILLPKLNRNAFTNGRGRFTLKDLPVGEHEVLVRRVGYKQLSTSVFLAQERTLEERFILTRLVVLDTIAVTSHLTDFEEHRKLGFGKFLTRAELEPQENRKLAEIVNQVGAGVLRNGNKAWVGGATRGPRSFIGRGLTKCAMLQGAEVAESQLNQASNPGCGCFAQVYLDNAVLYNGEMRGTVPDINLIVPASLEAIEYLKGPAQTPAKYSNLNSECGVLVLHTRRTPGKAKRD